MTISGKGKIVDFFSNHPEKRFKKGEVILKPDDSIHEIFYIQSGMVRQYSISQEGEEATLHVFHTGSYFPIMLVLASLTNKYYFEAMTDIIIMTASTPTVIEFIEKNPDVLLDLTTRFAEGICGLLEKIEENMHMHAYQRVISILLYLGKKFGHQEEPYEKEGIELHFSHNHIASWTGLQRETVSRQIEKLQKKHIVSSRNHRLVIHSLNALQKELALP